jgi:hypothetical protein
MQCFVLNLQPKIVESVDSSYKSISHCFHKLGSGFHSENAIALFQMTTSLENIHCLWCLCILTKRIPFTERDGSGSQYLTPGRRITPQRNST